MSKKEKTKSVGIHDADQLPTLKRVAEYLTITDAMVDFDGGNN